jgi:hypothetical protein
MTTASLTTAAHLIDRARRLAARKRAEWIDYELIKRDVANLNLSADDYETTMLKVARSLKLL